MLKDLKAYYLDKIIRKEVDNFQHFNKISEVNNKKYDGWGWIVSQISILGPTSPITNHSASLKPNVEISRPNSIQEHPTNKKG